tara:strand:- start:33 stop:236 length:204 start_codon:yes stop_codon:yes gene_type:complete
LLATKVSIDIWVLIRRKRVNIAKKVLQWITQVRLNVMNAKRAPFRGGGHKQRHAKYAQPVNTNKMIE